MQWHKGDVYDAVSKVKELQKYLFVFIRDEKTPQFYSNMLDTSTEIFGILKNSVCLNLIKDTPEFRQFSDVYEVTEIPAIYIITHQGEIVDIITGSLDEETLCNKLREIYGMESKVAESDDSKDSPIACNSNETLNMEENVNIEEKLNDVRKLLAEKHMQKAEEEKQKQKDEELKRREIGRQMHQLKQSQKEREEEEIKEELRRRKNEEKDARNKILRQIEEDKLERKQRFENHVASKPVVEILEDIQVTNRNINVESGVRLLFRFPDGSSVNNRFDNEDKFSVVRAFVAGHIRKNMGYFDAFEIKQFFPKRTLLTKDDGSSLAELQLVPSASFAVSLISKPTKSSQVSSIVNWTVSPINLILTTLASVFRWIRVRFIGSASNTTGTDHVNGDNTVSPPSPFVPSPSSNWEERQRRLLAAESRTIKKEGNLAGFSDATKKDDDDDDEARWNGNSTQQM